MAFSDEVVSGHRSTSDVSSFTTGNHVPTAAPSFVKVIISYRQLTSANVTNVTYGGAALSELTTSGAADGRHIDAWSLIGSVPTGTQTAAITWTGGNARGVVVTIITGTAAGTVTVRHFVGGTGSGAVPFTLSAAALTSNAADINYGACAINHGLAVIAPAGSETELDDQAGRTDAGGHHAQAQKATPAASITHQWAISTQGTDGGYVAFSLQEAAGGTTYTLTADTAAVAVAAQDVGLLHARRIAAESAAVAVSGQDASLEYSRRVAADSAAFVISAQDATLRRGRFVVADPAAYAIIASDVALRAARRLVADSLAVALSAQDVLLTYTSVVVATPGVFTITAQDIALRHGRIMTASPASIAITAPDAALRAARRIGAESSPVTINAQDVALLKVGDYAIIAEPAAFVLAAQDVGLLALRRMLAETASVNVAASDAPLLMLRRLGLDPLLLAITAQDVTLTYSGAIVWRARAMIATSAGATRIATKPATTRIETHGD